MTENHSVAYDVLGGSSTDDLMSPEQKKRLEESSKKRRATEMMGWSSAAGRRGPLLGLNMAGGKKPKRDRTNSPCHDCK